MKVLGWMVAVGMFVQSSAFADGFRCEGLTFGTKIEVYNKVKPSEGTRNANVLIVSDPNGTKGTRTIAAFHKDQGLLIQKGATYIATVDSRFKTVNHGNKNVAGTTLGELEVIRLTVNFNYTTDTPSQIGSKYSAVITYTKENGARISENASCIRYKKR